MYTPDHFNEDRLDTLHAVIENNNFGLLIAQVDGELVASHLPFLLDPARGPNGTLLVHMARANPQWPAFDGELAALAVFSGPHAYVSPNWYEPGKNNVPTWNYIAVHCSGTPVLMEDAGYTVGHLRRLVDRQERRFDDPWSLSAMPENYVSGMAKGVVVLEIPIECIEGKAKLSQNRTPADRSGVISALEKSPHSVDQRLAASMRKFDG